MWWTVLTMIHAYRDAEEETNGRHRVWPLYDSATPLPNPTPCCGLDRVARRQYWLVTIIGVISRGFERVEQCRQCRAHSLAHRPLLDRPNAPFIEHCLEQATCQCDKPIALHGIRHQGVAWHERIL